MLLLVLIGITGCAGKSNIFGFLKNKTLEKTEKEIGKHNRREGEDDDWYDIFWDNYEIIKDYPGTLRAIIHFDKDKGTNEVVMYIWEPNEYDYRKSCDVLEGMKKEYPKYRNNESDDESHVFQFTGEDDKPHAIILYISDKAGKMQISSDPYYEYGGDVNDKQFCE